MSMIRMVLVTVVCMAIAGSARAQDKSVEELQKETEQRCVETANTKPTPQMIIQKINAGAELIAKEGKDAFPKFKGKDSEFIFAGTYIWIHNLDGIMLMHPIKPKMDGQQILGMRDTKGKQLFAEMNRLVTEKGAGWIDYYWPKPGEKEGSLKVSYVKLVKRGDETFVIGCGVYDMTLEEVKQAAAN